MSWCNSSLLKYLYKNNYFTMLFWEHWVEHKKKLLSDFKLCIFLLFGNIKRSNKFQNRINSKFEDSKKDGSIREEKKSLTNNSSFTTKDNFENIRSIIKSKSLISIKDNENYNSKNKDFYDLNKPEFEMDINNEVKIEDQQSENHESSNIESEFKLPNIMLNGPIKERTKFPIQFEFVLTNFIDFTEFYVRKQSDQDLFNQVVSILTDYCIEYEELLNEFELGCLQKGITF